MAKKLKPVVRTGFPIRNDPKFNKSVREGIRGMFEVRKLMDEELRKRGIHSINDITMVTWNPSTGEFKVYPK